MSVPLSDTELAEIRERQAAATAGPWRATDATDACVSTIHSEGEQAKLLGRVAADADAEFIAHVREDLPALLAEVDRLRAELAAWQSAQDAVMAVAEDVNTPVTLAQVAKVHAHGLLAARRADAAKES